MNNDEQPLLGEWMPELTVDGEWIHAYYRMRATVIKQGQFIFTVSWN